MLRKYKSGNFSHTPYPYTILLTFILILGIVLLPSNVRCDKYEGTPIIQKDHKGQVKHYKTALGKLEAAMLLLDSSQLVRTGSKMELKEGYFAIDPHGAVSITNPVTVFKGKPYQVLTPLLITFVQDLATKEWLATNGLLYVRGTQAYLLEGQKIRVVGGKTNPLIINGQPFADTTLVILNGQPMKKTW